MFTLSSNCASICIGARTFPARSFPPDGTTFSQIALGQKLSKQIPPYSYWNMQFYQSEPAYIKFDYNIPRGASIGVYARRNALPTHTQYHFKEVLSGLTARTTRATPVSNCHYIFFFNSAWAQNLWYSQKQNRCESITKMLYLRIFLSSRKLPFSSNNNRLLVVK